jgi:hypothetical protein
MKNAVATLPRRFFRLLREWFASVSEGRKARPESFHTEIRSLAIDSHTPRPLLERKPRFREWGSHTDGNLATAFFYTTLLTNGPCYTNSLSTEYKSRRNLFLKQQLYTSGLHYRKKDPRGSANPMAGPVL